MFSEIILSNIASKPKQIQISWKGQEVGKLSDQQQITQYLGNWLFMPEHKLTRGQWKNVLHTVTVVYRWQERFRKFVIFWLKHSKQQVQFQFCGKGILILITWSMIVTGTSRSSLKSNKGLQEALCSILSFQLISFVILVFYSNKINSQNSTSSLHNHRFLNHRVLWLYDTWCYHTTLLIPIQMLHIRMEVQLDQPQLSLHLLHIFCWLTQTNKSEIQFPQLLY